MEEETAATSFSISVEASAHAVGPIWLKMQEYNNKKEEKKKVMLVWGKLPKIWAWTACSFNIKNWSDQRHQCQVGLWQVNGATLRLRAAFGKVIAMAGQLAGLALNIT